MGEHAHDLIVAELIASGLNTSQAAYLASYMEPDHQISNAQDISFLFEGDLSFLIPDEMKKIAIETSDIDYLDPFDIYANPFEILKLLKINRPLKSAKIYIDGSNMLFQSSKFKQTYVGDEFISYVFEFMKKKDKYRYSYWYLPVVILEAITIGEELLYDPPNIFIYSNDEKSKRHKWINFLENELQLKAHIITDKNYKTKKKGGYDPEDLAMMECINQDLISGSVDHFIICTGDGNDDNINSFPRTISKLLENDKQVSVCNFGGGRGSSKIYIDDFCNKDHYSYYDLTKSFYFQTFMDKFDLSDDDFI